MKIVLQDWKYGRIMRYTYDVYIGNSLGLYGEYSPVEMGIYKQLLRPGDIVVEVGANIGSLTVPLAQHIGPGGKIYAFEPQRITFQVLCGNVALNNLFNVWAYNKGAGKEHKKVKIFDGLLYGNNGAFSVERYPGNFEVEIIALDELNLEKCNLLKIDAEGMDVEVIQGAENLIKRCRPYISMEANYTKAGKEIIKKLQSLGYKVYEADCALYNQNNDFQTTINIFLQKEGTMKYTDGQQYDGTQLLNVVSCNWLCVPDNEKIEFVGDVVDINKWKD